MRDQVGLKKKIQATVCMLCLKKEPGNIDLGRETAENERWARISVSW